MEREKGAAIDEDVGDEQKELLGVKLRKGISVGKRGGNCTPSISWKMEEDTGAALDKITTVPSRRSAEISARKLGAGLWEIQDLLPAAKIAGHHRRRRKEDPLIDIPPINRGAGSLRRHVAAPLVQHHQLNERYNQALRTVSPTTNSSSVEVSAFNQAITPSSSLDLNGRPGESRYSLKTSTELLKVLNRIWSLEEQHTSNVSQVKALKAELEHARSSIRVLMQEKQAYHHEMDNLMSQVAEDNFIRKNKEQDKIKAALKSTREELEDERRLRRRSESLHRKLGRELSEVKSSLSRALKDTENEREANYLLEGLCDVFAKGVTDYEQEVRELRQRSKKNCDHRIDRSILHISETWLDERLQMKVAEAQGDLAEKSSIIDRLSGEIKTFLQEKPATSSKNEIMYQKDGNLQRQSLESVHLNGNASAPRDAEDDDSIVSDLHSFELNMNANDNGNTDQLKLHCGDPIEKSEASKKSNFTRKNRVFSEKNNSRGSSFMEAQLEEQTDRHELFNGNGSKTKLADRMQGLHLHISPKTRGPDANHVDTVMTQKSDDCRTQKDDQDIEFFEGCKLHNGNYHGDESHSRFSWMGHFDPTAKDNSSVAFHTVSSPVQRWSSRHISPEITECSSKSPKEGNKNTLKAKLLEARLEGRHARLKASKGSAGESQQ